MPVLGLLQAPQLGLPLPRVVKLALKRAIQAPRAAGSIARRKWYILIHRDTQVMIWNRQELTCQWSEDSYPGSCLGYLIAAMLFHCNSLCFIMNLMRSSGCCSASRYMN